MNGETQDPVSKHVLSVWVKSRATATMIVEPEWKHMFEAAGETIAACVLMDRMAVAEWMEEKLNEALEAERKT